MKTTVKKWFFCAVLCLLGVSVNAQVTFMRAAEDGDANAQYKLGRMYSQDNRYQKDIKKAMYWYKKAAAQNQKDAALALGELYYYGIETDRNNHLAYTYFNQADTLGNYEASYCLGEMYEKGVGVNKNLQTAFSYYKKAADKGNLAKAMFKTGTMLYYGQGCTKDIAKGNNYIKLAFNEGYPTALEFWNQEQLWQYED